MTDKKYFWPVVTGIIFIGLFLGMTFYYMRTALAETDETIAQHIQQLEGIFTRINNQCKIRAFEDDVDVIDYLNTVSFAGNQVGSMQLIYPKQWKGPYLEKNLEVQGKEYHVVKAKQGHYIVPGLGVKLQNGKMLGSDIVIKPDTDIEALIKDPHGLQTKAGKPLAAKIPMIRSGFDLLAEASLYETPVNVY